MAKRHDPFSDLVRSWLLARIAEHEQKTGEKLTQKELARLAKIRHYQKIQRFLAGDMPYPPMAFLNSLTRVFGSTLLEVLAGSPTPTNGGAAVPPSRADVRAVVQMLEEYPEFAPLVRQWTTGLIRAMQRREGTHTTPA